MSDVFSRPWRFPAPIHDDEDINSLVVRMADYGCMSRAEFLRHYMKASSVMFSEGTYQFPELSRLAILAGVDDDTILRNAMTSERRIGSASRNFRGTPLRGIGLHLHKRIAPGMLKSDGEDPYIRLAWRFEVLIADPDTGEVLQSRCLNCTNRLLWRSPKLWQCEHCRFDLREAPPVFLAELDLAAIRKLGGALGVYGTASSQPLNLEPPFDGLELGEQFKALAWLAGLRGRMESNRLAATETNCYLGLELAENWERTVQQLVTLVFRQTAGEPADIAHSLVRCFDSIPDRELRTKMVAFVARHAAMAVGDPTYVSHRHSDKMAKYVAFPTYAVSELPLGAKRRTKSVRRPRPIPSS